MSSSPFVIVHEERATRYEIVVTEAFLREYTYVISVPNFFFSMATETPWNVAYKMKEKGINSADADIIEKVLRRYFNHN